MQPYITRLNHKGMKMEELSYMCIKNFAKCLGIHPNTVRRCIKRGKIQAVDLGTHKRPLYRIPVSEINRIAAFDLEKLIKTIAQS